MAKEVQVRGSPATSPVWLKPGWLALAIVLAALAGATVAALPPEYGFVITASLAAALLLYLVERLTGFGDKFRSGCALVMLLVAAVPWQVIDVTGVLDVGSVSAGSSSDLLKTAVTAAALGLAYTARYSPVAVPPVVKWMFGFTVLACVSAFIGEDFFSSITRAVRFAAVIVAVFWCTTRLSQEEIVRIFVVFAVTVCAVSLCAFLAGVDAGLDGRLRGFVLPLHPNNLGILAAAGLLCVVNIASDRGWRSRIVVFCVPVLAVSILLTQSRTAVAAFGVGLIAIALPDLRARGRQVAGAIVALTVVVALLEFGTDSGPINYVLTHDQTTTVTGNLDVRFSAWNAAFQTNDTPIKVLLGSGLAAKSVVVNLSSAAFTSVDGTWPSAYLSGGLVGAFWLALVVLGTSVSAFVSRNGVAFGVTALLIICALSSSVFNDVTLGLVIWLMFASGVGRNSSPSGLNSSASQGI